MISPSPDFRFFSSKNDGETALLNAINICGENIKVKRL
jgi:hypothetical protein